MATRRWSSKTMRIRSGLFCGSIYWVLLVSGRVSVPKPLSQIQSSTRWLLQGLSPRTSFGGFGLSTPLEPSAETFVSWVHVVRTPGDYLIEFSTWKDPSFAAGGVLDRKPSPPEVLIAGQDPARFQLGQAVVTTIDLEVRQGPGHAFPEVTNPSYAGHAPAGTTGAVVGGPVSSAGTTWWRVQYTPGYVGWSSESGLSGR